MARYEENMTEEPRRQTVSSIRQLFETRSARAPGRQSAENVVLPVERRSSANLRDRLSFFEANGTRRNNVVAINARPSRTVDESLSSDSLSSIESRIQALQASVKRSEPHANIRRRPKGFDVSDDDLPSVKSRSKFFETPKTAKDTEKPVDKTFSVAQYEYRLRRFREYLEILDTGTSLWTGVRDPYRE